MGLLDFFTSNAGDGSAPLLGQPQPAFGLLAPPQPADSPAQQTWMDALGVISAGLRDAGAYLQHQPQAADNVAAFARQRSGLQPGNAISSLAGLSPMVTAALLLSAARQRQAPQPPNGAAPQPGTALRTNVTHGPKPSQLAAGRNRSCHMAAHDAGGACAMAELTLDQQKAIALASARARANQAQNATTGQFSTTADGNPRAGSTDVASTRPPDGTYPRQPA
jgi:hypothetical protein